MNATTNVMITGVGGQGNVLAAKLLATVALAAGWEVTVGDVYGLTQRGGAVASHIRWTRGSALPPLIPDNALDILVAFEPLEALRMQTQYGQRQTAELVNQQPVMPIGVQAGRLAYPDRDALWSLLAGMSGELQRIDGTQAAKALGNLQVLNTVMLGALCASGWVAFPPDLFEAVIREQLPERLIDLNLQAFRTGLELCQTPIAIPDGNP